MIVFVGRDHTVHGTFFTKNFGESTSIDSGDSGNIELFQEILNGVLATEVAGETG